MIVSANLQSRVNAKLVECISVLEKHYGRKFDMPRVEYNRSVHNAGLAYCESWKIKLSAPLLTDPVNTEEMIEQTTPHELAHLVAYALYPDTMKVRYVGGKMTKREVHGPRWQEVMRVMGLQPDRCHAMALSTDAPMQAVAKRQVRFDWVCTGCNKTIQLGPKHNNMMLTGSAQVWHRGCRNAKLVKPGTKSSVPNPTTPMKLFQTPVPTAPVQPVAKTNESKIDKCKFLYQRNMGLNRTEMLQLFVEKAGCTAAGATTYYQTCKKLFG